MIRAGVEPRIPYRQCRTRDWPQVRHSAIRRIRVYGPPQARFLKVAWGVDLVRTGPGSAMTFRIVNEPLGAVVVACRETTTAPLSVIRTAHTGLARVPSRPGIEFIAPSSCLAFIWKPPPLV